jgi:hypothetical protein
MHSTLNDSRGAVTFGSQLVNPRLAHRDKRKLRGHEEGVRQN